MTINNCLAIFYQKLALIKQLFHFIFSNKLIRLLAILSLFINLLISTLFFIKIGFRSNIPLHYNVYFSIDLIGNWYQLLIIPFFGLMVLVVNFILAMFTYLKEKMLSYFLVGSALVIQILLLFACLSIIWLNT